MPARRGRGTTWLAVEAQLDTRDSRKFTFGSQRARSDKANAFREHASSSASDIVSAHVSIKCVCAQDGDGLRGQKGSGAEGLAGLAVRVFFQKVAK